MLYNKKYYIKSLYKKVHYKKIPYSKVKKVLKKYYRNSYKKITDPNDQLRYILFGTLERFTPLKLFQLIRQRCPKRHQI